MKTRNLMRMSVVGTLLLVAGSENVALGAHERLYALTTRNNLISFYSDAPGTILSARAITGLQSGERIRGIDFNAANGLLYGIGSSSRLYTINPNTGAATQVGTGQFSTLLDGQSFASDSGPADLVVVSDLRQNLSVNRSTGVVNVGPSLAYTPADPLAGTAPRVSALAYDATSTTWYAGDSLFNTFGTFNPATGVITTLGAAGIDFSKENGLDISPATGIMYLASPAASSDPAANLYVVNKATGAVTLIGLIGSPGENILLRALTVVSQPKICVTKEVACELPTGCGSFAAFASGAKTADNSQCPSFCYRVRVTNCGEEDLNNVTVVDNVLDISACNWPTSLAVGQTVECILAGVKHCDNVTNTVTVTGIGAASGSNVTASATAAVEVLPIDITCNLTVNGQSSTTIRCDGQVHLVTNAVEICNTGTLPLTGITIQSPELVALGGDCTNFTNLRLSLLPGQCTNVLLCTDIVTCQPTNGACAYTNHPTVTVTGVVDATNSSACPWTRNPSNQVVAVTASSSCSVTVVVVVDITPPQVACIPGVNPSDKKIPVAGKNPSSGQNPDGYYQLLAKDDCDPNPVIYLADTGSSFVAGPFHSGDVIKLTQSPGKTPSQDPAPDPIVAHLHFKGDAALYAVDAHGNVSEACLCLVPRPPK